MKTFLILAVFVAAAAAGQYNYQPSNGPSYHQSSGGYPQQQQQQRQQGQVYRHVYVHTAPEEPEDRQNKILRVPGNQDKHVNIIFVKTPSTDSLQNTEIELPQQGEQKTLVYVLLRKGEANSDVKIRGPAPTQPSKPEVYFIRYKNEEEEQKSYQQAPPSPPRPQYGAPF